MEKDSIMSFFVPYKLIMFIKICYLLCSKPIW